MLRLDAHRQKDGVSWRDSRLRAGAYASRWQRAAEIRLFSVWSICSFTNTNDNVPTQVQTFALMAVIKASSGLYKAYVRSNLSRILPWGCSHESFSVTFSEALVYFWLKVSSPGAWVVKP
jgi:hypothetical protein